MSFVALFLLLLGLCITVAVSSVYALNAVVPAPSPTLTPSSRFFIEDTFSQTTGADVWLTSVEHTPEHGVWRVQSNSEYPMRVTTGNGYCQPSAIARSGAVLSDMPEYAHATDTVQYDWIMTLPAAINQPGVHSYILVQQQDANTDAPTYRAVKFTYVAADSVASTPATVTVTVTDSSQSGTVLFEAQLPAFAYDTEIVLSMTLQPDGTTSLSVDGAVLTVVQSGVPPVANPWMRVIKVSQHADVVNSHIQLNYFAASKR